MCESCFKTEQKNNKTLLICPIETCTGQDKVTKETKKKRRPRNRAKTKVNTINVPPFVLN